MLSPLRQTLRRLAHEHGFATTVLLTLALCIGANLAIFAAANLFETLGMQPALGRAFIPEEQQAGRDTVAVLSDACHLFLET